MRRYRWECPCGAAGDPVDDYWVGIQAGHDHQVAAHEAEVGTYWYRAQWQTRYYGELAWSMRIEEVTADV